jgi:hypothetical protein
VTITDLDCDQFEARQLGDILYMSRWTNSRPSREESSEFLRCRDDTTVRICSSSRSLGQRHSRGSSRRPRGYGPR